MTAARYWDDVTDEWLDASWWDDGEVGYMPDVLPPWNEDGIPADADAGGWLGWDPAPIPAEPGIYWVWSEGGILYVGGSLNLAERVAAVLAGSYRWQHWRMYGVAYRTCAVSDLATLEREMIARYDGVNNIEGRERPYKPHGAWSR